MFSDIEVLSKLGKVKYNIMKTDLMCTQNPGHVKI